MPIVECPPEFCQYKDKNGRGTQFHIAPSHLARMKRPPTCSRECRAASMAGRNHWLWKGGRYIDSEGYVRVYVEDISEIIDGADAVPGYVLEHRKVMALAKGRALREDEVVHHRDEDRQNNAPDNLELMADRGHHTMTHHVTRGRTGKFRSKAPQSPASIRKRNQAAFERLRKRAPRPGR